MKNGDLNPDQFSPGSAKKVWWQCRKGHEWEAQIRSRYMGVNCQECKGRLPASEMNLEARYPDLAREWHRTRNKQTPNLFTTGSNKKVWWKCSKGHEWQTTICNRTRLRKSGCPYCYGKKAGEDNNLSVKHPEVAREWNRIKNTLTPKQYTAGSNKRVWWKCPKGHEWEARVASRTINQSGCPQCSGRKIDKDNNLIINFPEIVKEWHPVKNGDLTPMDVKAGSTKKVWWKCEKCHEWQAEIRFRTQRGTGCPKCAIKKAAVKKKSHYTRNEKACFR